MALDKFPLNSVFSRTVLCRASPSSQRRSFAYCYCCECYKLYQP